MKYITIFIIFFIIELCKSGEIVNLPGVAFLESGFDAAKLVSNQELTTSYKIFDLS